MFDILQEIVQSHPFLMSRDFEEQGYQWYGVQQIKSIWVEKRIVDGIRFGAPLLSLHVVLISSIKPIVSLSAKKV